MTAARGFVLRRVDPATISDADVTAFAKVANALRRERDPEDPPRSEASFRANFAGMAAFEEETFGPVAAIVRAENRERAVELANLSSYGLGASIWTGDRAAGRELAAEIEAGCVFVNEIVKSDPRLPFGGIKESGYGRELGPYGIKEFVNIKTVWVR